MLQRKHSLLIGEVEPITAAVRQKFHFRIGLSLVRLKDEWQMAVGGQNFASILRVGDI